MPMEVVMGNDRNCVAAREFYPWELEFPSKKSASKAFVVLKAHRFDCYLDEECVYVKADRPTIEKLLDSLAFKSTWLPLEEQISSIELANSCQPPK